MKKVFLSLMAVISAVTMMAQSQPTACDAKLEFKFCFTTYGIDAQEVYSSQLPYEWNNYTFPTDGTYPMQAQGTITNARGCDSVVTMTLSVKMPPTGAAGGNKAKAFSVSATKQVFFSQGNLQFCPNPLSGDKTHATAEGTANGIWRFAENQYDYVGLIGCVNGGEYVPGNVKYNNGTTMVDSRNIPNGTNLSTANAYNGWIDLFGWGTSGYNGTQPASTAYTNPISAGKSDYMPYNHNLYDSGYENYDWGVYNAISNGGNEYGKWRTLSYDEWDYVLYKRTNASDKIARATVKGTPGVILLPDDWKLPSGLSIQEFKTGVTSSSSQKWDYNVLTESDWEKMEEAGAVFTPAAGHTNRQSTSYWSYAEWHYFASTKYTFENTNNPKPYYFFFIPTNCGSGNNSCWNGYAVRLVADK